MCKKYKPKRHIELRVIGDFSLYAFEVDEPHEGVVVKGRVPCWWALALIGGCQG